MTPKHDNLLVFLWELKYSFQELKDVLDKIPIKEAQWLPTNNSKTLKTLIQWNKLGNKWLDEQQFDPFATIEFLISHLAHCKIMYRNYAFEEGNLQWQQLESPEWPKSINFIENSQERLISSIHNFNDANLETKVKTNWGDYWTVKKILFTLIHHDAYHLGQINLLRKLYKYKVIEK